MSEPMDYEQLRENPSIFVSEILGVSPFNYQKEFLDADSRFKQFVSGRQVGKSRTCAWAGLAYAMTHPSTLTLITAPSLRQSSNLFKVVRSEMSQSGYSDDAWGVDRDTQTIIELDNDSEIVCLPVGNDGSKIRGYTADMIIVDEAAFVDDFIFEDTLRPMTFATGGDILLASTPFGTSGFFYDAYISEDWHTTHAQTSDSPLVSQADLEEYKEGKTQTQIKREVLGEFVSGDDRFFDPEDIRPVLGDPEYTGDAAYMGADIAASGSAETVLSMVDDEGNVFDIKEFSNIGVLEAADKISLLDTQYHFDEIVVDRGGLGHGTVEALAERANIAPRVREIYFTIQTKQELYQSLKASIQASELVLPTDNKILKGQLEDIGYTETASKNLSLKAEDGNDDYVDSLAMAVDAIPETAGKARTVGAQGATSPVMLGDMRDGNPRRDGSKHDARERMDEKRPMSMRIDRRHRRR